ncbi:hypothetical protein [Coxiella-like endosymbiont]|uniref:hypothetical protein n=1 Tax=Coxiella-like endosymbiont TaxID=1592897 RepID=UPI00272AA3A3|nr:hypothetical protein [Coxiella-like endosymbiont]
MIVRIIEGLYPSFSFSDSQVPLFDPEETDTAYLKQLTRDIQKNFPRHLSKFTSVASIDYWLEDNAEGNAMTGPC